MIDENQTFTIECSDETTRNLLAHITQLQSELEKKDAEIIRLSQELTSQGYNSDTQVLRLRAELKAERAKVQQLEAQIAHRHILGKAYEVSQESINKLAGELDDERAENVKLKEALKQIEIWWDISDPTNVVPSKKEKEPARNDSMAAHSIIMAINALKESGDE